MAVESGDKMRIVIYYAVWATICATVAGIAIALIHTWLFSYIPNRSGLIHTLFSDAVTALAIAAGQGAVVLVTGSVLAQLGPARSAIRMIASPCFRNAIRSASLSNRLQRNKFLRCCNVGHILAKKSRMSSGENEERPATCPSRPIKWACLGLMSKHRSQSWFQLAVTKSITGALEPLRPHALA